MARTAPLRPRCGLVGACVRKRRLLTQGVAQQIHEERRAERGVSRLVFDAFNHEILEGFIPADDGIHAGLGKVPRPETPSSIP